ncbi:MAG: DUF2961 domain-containing protein, partial [Bacteroidales bacterium]|nr:DUF2961 domain-containing protein [Bacteroidales bacterium]
PEDVDDNPRYYQINYRKYDRSAQIETFSEEVALKAKSKIEEVNIILLNPYVQEEGGIITRDSSKLTTGDSLLINLPGGEMAVYELIINIDVPEKLSYEQCMRELILSVMFDDKETIWVPLGDFSGGGMGSKPVSSWFLYSDGQGEIVSRWLMPYQSSASINLKNYSNKEIGVRIVAKTARYNWDKHSLYFHTSWKQETGLWLSNCGEDINKPSCREWNFTTLNGRGVYGGDALTLFNKSKSWYGEGDEKIWVDNDTFPSHFGTGTEDYYNSSWAPVVIFQTPFGGAIRADSLNSRGYNTWLRTRNMDGIPFKSKLQFDLELLSWFSGKADYSSTVYWYGDKNAEALKTSGINEAVKILLPINQSH